MAKKRTNEQIDFQKLIAEHNGFNETKEQIISRRLSKTKSLGTKLFEFAWQFKYLDDMFVFESVDFNPRSLPYKGKFPLRDKIVNRKYPLKLQSAITVTLEQMNQIKTCFWEFFNSMGSLEPISPLPDVNRLLGGKLYILQNKFPLVLEVAAANSGMTPDSILRAMKFNFSEILKNGHRVFPFYRVDYNGKYLELTKNTSDAYVSRILQLIDRQIAIDGETNNKLKRSPAKTKKLIMDEPKVPVIHFPLERRSQVINVISGFIIFQLEEKDQIESILLDLKNPIKKMHLDCHVNEFARQIKSLVNSGAIIIADKKIIADWAVENFLVLTKNRRKYVAIKNETFIDAYARS